MIKRLFRKLIEHMTFKKRKSQILQTATDFWNECENKIKEQEKYDKAI